MTSAFRIFLALLIVFLLAAPLAAAQTNGAPAGYWRLAKVEVFDSPVWNGPGSSIGYLNLNCPGEVMSLALAAPNRVVFTHSVPAGCQVQPMLSKQVHEWTPIADILKPGEVVRFATTSRVAEVAGPVFLTVNSMVIGGFVPFDAPPSVAPYLDQTVASSEATPAKGPGFVAMSNNEFRAPEVQKRVPAYPFLGADLHDRQIRFRVYLFTGTIWKSVDRVYQWTIDGQRTPIRPTS